MGNEQSVPLSAYQARIQQQQQRQAGAQRAVPRRPQPRPNPATRRPPPPQDAAPKPKTSTFLPPDPFVFFGLTPECTEEQAKRAYYRKTREHHPDRGGDVQLFAWIHQAYITVLHQIQERNQRVDEHLVRRTQYQRTAQEQTHQATASQVMQQVYQPTQTQTRTDRPQHQQNPFDIQREREQELQQPRPDFQAQPQQPPQQPPQQQFQQQTGTNYQPPARPVGPEPKFQADKFNRIFEETRIERPSDRGYSPEELDRAMNQLPQAPVLNGQSQLRGGARDQFMNQFNQYKQQVQQQNEQSTETDERTRRKKQLAKYRGPEALVSTSFANCVELGDEEVDDYTAPIQSRMGYTDYQGAYTRYHQLEAPEEELQRRPKNLESYQAERERVRFQMSADEEAQLAALKAYEEEQERMRIERLQEADRLAELQHEKAKRFYLQGRGRK